MSRLIISSFARLPFVFAFLLVFVFSTCKKETPAPAPEPQPALPVLPAVSTMPVSEISSHSAKSGGNVTSEGNSAVTSVGLCWDTLPGPTTLRNVYAAGVGTGGFVAKLDSLKPGKKYFVRAYARNLGGTAYGNEVEFTTLLIPSAVDNITGKNFRISAVSASPALNGVTDIYSTWENCSKDDFFRFEKSGSVLFDEGGTKCDVNSPQTNSGTWLLLNGDKQLMMTIDGSTTSYDVLKNDGKDLIFNFKTESGGTTYTLTYVLKVF